MRNRRLLRFRTFVVFASAALLLSSLRLSRASEGPSSPPSEDTRCSLPKHPSPTFEEGIHHVDQAEYNLAIKAFTEELRHGGDMADAYNNRGVAYDSSGAHDKAIEDYRAALRYRPQFPTALFNLAGAYYDRGRYDDALLKLSEALRYSPNYPAALLNRGAIYVVKGDLNSGIADFSHAIAENPSYKKALQSRGRAYFYAGKFESAAADFEAVTKIDPNDPYVILWHYLSAARLGKPSDLPSKVPTDKWPWPIVSYYRDEMTLEDLQKIVNQDATTKVARTCESAFFIAERQILTGQMDRARMLLVSAHGDCPLKFLEREAAEFELKRLQLSGPNALPERK